MAASSTYVPLISYTLPSSAASMTITNIPTTYTDLRIVVNALVSMAYAGTYITANFQVGSSNTIDTTASYGATTLYADTSAAGSSSLSGATGTSIKYTQDVMAQSTDTGARSVNFFDIMDYSNTTTYKSMLIRSNTKQNVTGTNMLRQSTATWRNTGAINTIRYTADGANLYAGSTITIYGIANNTAGAKATGGVITSDSDYFYHSFYATDTFTPTQSLSCDYLVVAGGGGGASGYGGGGGGGAGGLRSTVTTTGAGGSLETPLSVTAQAYTITVGAGGAGGANGASNNGTIGGNSVFSSITSTGGGFGGASSTAGNGGSGGGAGWQYPTAGTGTTGQGRSGGAGANDGAGAAGGGGGGGADTPGTAGTTSAPGNGGAGVATSISGLSVTYAGGGGAGRNDAGTLSSGGIGGGGTGGGNNIDNAVAGTANTGGGGGAGGGGYKPGKAGGSGLVIIRYAR